MANTYSQIYIHVVFAVHARQNLIRSEHKDELQKYMTGIVTAQSQKLIAINNMPDHFHLLIGLRPTMALSDLVQDIKSGSSAFINKRRWVNGRFEWQEGVCYHLQHFVRTFFVSGNAHLEAVVLADF